MSLYEYVYGLPLKYLCSKQREYPLTSNPSSTSSFRALANGKTEVKSSISSSALFNETCFDEKKDLIMIQYNQPTDPKFPKAQNGPVYNMSQCDRKLSIQKPVDCCYLFCVCWI